MAELITSQNEGQGCRVAEKAADLLRRGEVVGIPTETVYGLAANALDPAAVARIFEIKGRPSHNPIIVHVEGLEMARRSVSEWPAAAEKLANAFWPGPLTLVLPGAESVPDAVTAGGPTVGIRWPAHPVTRAIIRACGFPLAAPSANPSNQLSPTQASHVQRLLGDKIPLIVDGGPCSIGIESTVLDLTSDPIRILRPGMIHAESIEAVLQTPVAEADSSDQGAARDGNLRSPGLLDRHYSTEARLVVRRWNQGAGLADGVQGDLSGEGQVHVLAREVPSGQPEGSVVHALPREPEAFARALYAELHACDLAGARLIVVQEPPDTAAWRGIRDRLRRAST